MSELDRLLDGVDVEWKTLDDICFFQNGKGHEKDISSDGRYVVVNSKFISTEGKVVKYSNTQICPLFTDDILIVMSDLPNGKALAKTYLVDQDNKYSLNQRIGRITSKNKLEVLPKFLNYILNRTQQLLRFNNGADQTNLRKKQILSVKIPIPCPDNPEKSLAIQKEIVRILDTFTELTTELTTELATELTARKKQYGYYREQLLRFRESEVEWKKISDTLERTRGTKITAGRMKELNKEGAPLKIFAGGKTKAFFNFDDIPSRDINREPSIIVKSRGVIEFEYYDKPFSHKNEMWSYHSKDVKVNIKFVYYFLKINEPYFQNIASRMQMPQISTPVTEKFKIPIPPIEKQERIVNILDKFDVLTTSISEVLPKEIELRNKQYEYYRKQLLSF